MKWLTVYDLRDDLKFVADVQRATLTTREYGIEPTHGLFGSDQWWQQIECGVLPRQTLRGTISRVYMASMGDWPEFEIKCDDGSLRRFTRFQTPSDGSRDGLYKEGRAIEVDYVVQQKRREAPNWGLPRESPSVVAIRVAAE